jgi:chloramphenicol 3-O phosphotransferase
MIEISRLGQIVILNGVPRSGKSSIAAAMQATLEGVWMNLGVDVFAREVTPPRLRPGIGLRPGELDHPTAAYTPVLYAAMYESIAVHSRLGLNVVVDVGHYDRVILADCARRLAGLPVLFVGVRCPIAEIMRRRNVGDPGREHAYLRGSAGDPVPEPVRRWQGAVHAGVSYDLEVDTSTLSPAACAEAIAARLLADPLPDAFNRIAMGD